MKILVVVQARMSSTRFPGKVLLPLAGRPLLERMLERVRAARTPFDLCVATTPDEIDRPIRDLADRIGVRVFAGHPFDLVDRHYRAGLASGADVVVKIPSDCPLIDPAVIDRVLSAYLAATEGVDFVTNLWPPSWPDGNDVEVLPMRVLATVFEEATDAFDREHTTPFVWKRPERFRIRNVEWEAGLDYSSSHRLTLDYPEDYALIEQVYRALLREGTAFSLPEILGYLQNNPHVLAMNARFHGSSYYRPAAAERPQRQAS